jgi:hypothetical protein
MSGNEALGLQQESAIAGGGLTFLSLKANCSVVLVFILAIAKIEFVSTYTPRKQPLKLLEKSVFWHKCRLTTAHFRCLPNHEHLLESL